MYERGIHIGNLIIELYQLLEQNGRAGSRGDSSKSNKGNVIFGVSKEFVEGFWLQYEPINKNPEFSGLLERIIPNRGIDLASVLQMVPSTEFYDYDKNWGPLSEYDRRFGLAPIGSWGGDSDGDAWAFDLNNDCIVSVCVDGYGDTLDEVQQELSYHCSTTTDWFTFLIDKLRERGHLNQNDFNSFRNKVVA